MGLSKVFEFLRHMRLVLVHLISKRLWDVHGLCVVFGLSIVMMLAHNISLLYCFEMQIYFMHLFIFDHIYDHRTQKIKLPYCHCLEINCKGH